MATSVDSGSALTGFQPATTASSSATDKGTKIVQKGDNGLDKNSFLRILTAELSNQDPLSGNNDPTQYVSQLAQFSSLEQMANLNGTMSLNSASNLIGKAVEFKDLDSMGQNYVGIIKSVTKDGDKISLNFDYKDNGKITSQSLDYSHVISASPNVFSTTDNTTSLGLAANLIGKSVKFSDVDSKGKNYEGIVKSVVKGDGDEVGLSIDVADANGKTVTQNFSYNDVLSINPAATTSGTSTTSSSVV